MTIKIGTRKSKLAMWQAFYVKEALEKQGASVEIIDIETKGDKQLKVSIAEIGSKGVFTEELEEMLLSGEVDIAVHSAKDMQSSLDSRFEILAFSSREDASDVLVSNNKNLDFRKGVVIGTSSARRTALIKHHYPEVKTVGVRGNLQTRIKKMEDGLCDGLLLAFAGVHRMGYDHLIAKKIPLDTFIPAVGQGTIAIESAVQMDKDKKDLILKAIHDDQTGHCLDAERSFLRRLEGGCSIPAFCNATLDANLLTVHGGIVSMDGKQLITEKISGDIKDAERLGNMMAEKILLLGGDKILQDIRGAE